MERLSLEGPTAGVSDESAEVSAETVNALIRARRARAKFMPDDMFAEPAWDMMLDLLRAEIEGERIYVSSLCIASGVPPTTALRWIGSMVEKGLFVRSSDPRDGRRAFIALTPTLSRSLRHYFAATFLPCA